MRIKSTVPMFAAGLLALAAIGEGTAQYVPYYPAAATPYPYGYGIQAPGGAYLSGAADVIGAQGQYLKDRQDAYTAKEKAYQERIKSRKMVFDQRQYELANTPSKDQVAEMTRQQYVMRSMTNPPPDEVVNGQALNALLQEYALRAAKGERGPNVPVNPESLGHINVTSAAKVGKSGGNTSFIKQPDFQWPTALRSPMFKKPVEEFEANFSEAVDQAKAGDLDQDLVDKLDHQLGTMRATMSASVAQFSLGDSMHALEYLDSIRGSIDALKDPGMVRMVASGTTSPKGSDVAEVVDSMTSRGLKFAPATPGYENDYLGFHAAMARYGLSWSSAALSSQPQNP